MSKNDTLRQQVGQLLVLGYDGLAIDSKLRTTLATLQPGGVILFARNIEEPAQTWRLLRDSQAATSVPMFLCVDLEGGTVDRLKKVIAPAPSVQDVFATGNRKLFRMHGNILGLEARALGFNTDFAPVFDLGFEASRSVLTSRTASADPQQTIAYAREFLRGLKAAKVLGCGKHFPGLGEANLDSHHDMPVVQKSWKKMWAEDLAPYRELRRQIPFVMVAHASYPEVTHNKLPASLSRKWMQDVLRKKIGYRGLIISDDLEMGGVLKAAPIDEAAVEFVRAGGDLCLICHQQEFVEQAFETVQRTFERDAAFRRRIGESAKKIAAFKRKHAKLLRMPGPPSQEKIDRLSRQLWEFSERVRLQQMAVAARAGAGA